MPITDPTNSVTLILGHEFRRMTEQDYEGLAGAGFGALICNLPDGTTLVAELAGGGDTPADDIWDIHEVDNEGHERWWRGTPI